MFRAIPTNNKLCFDKQLKRSWKIHEQKLKAIKSSISKSAPKHYQFLDQRAKRIALQDIRNIQIQKQNHSLLSKIKAIGEKGSKNSYLKNGNSIDKKKTLNEGFRKKQLVKIVEQNQQIIKRIHQKKSVYNIRRWEKQRKQVQKNITLISSYPYKDYPKTQTKVNLWMVDDENSSQKMRVQNFSLSRSRFKKQDIIFSGTHKIDDSYYLVQTNFQNKLFTIQIENLQKVQQKYKLQMGQKQAFEMIENNFEGKLKNLLNSLQIDHAKGTCELKCFLSQKAGQESMELRNRESHH